MSASTSGDSARAPRRRRQRLGAVVGKLTAVNSLLVLGGFLTGPLQARALGTTGRGEIAAINATLGFAPTLVSFGLGTYAVQAVARGRRTGDVLGTTIPMYLGLCAAIGFAAFPLSAALSGGHSVVREFLLIGLLTLPLSLVGALLLDVVLGLEMWNVVVGAKLVNIMLGTLPILVLYFVGALSVTAAAIVGLVTSASLVIPLVALVRTRPWPLRFRRAIVRESVPFGAKAWLGGISSVTNGRLDQVIMIDFVSARQLGLYAVAVSLSTVFISLVVSAMQYAMVPQVSRGDPDLVRTISRAAVAGSVIIGCATAVASPFVVPLAFGSQFGAAEPMLLVLLLGSASISLNAILAPACTYAGRPGVSARAEIYAVLITVPGLLLLLPSWGGVGAAAVSVTAYSTTAVYLVREARRQFGGSVADYVIPRRDTIALLRTVLYRATAKFAARVPRFGL